MSQALPHPIALLFPMAAMVLLTFVVLLRLFRARVRAVRAAQLPVAYYRLYQGATEPEAAAKPSRHLVNLFEAPVLFYAACLAALALGLAQASLVALAWAYVAARLLHSYVHLGSNRIRWRLRAYFASWLILLALWADLLWMAALG
ncbi:MAG TPA: MAPEG family protein [Steroidobacteraceae bacterium]|nr:MAPEG family protein [Steroidobacteraceae bacterium]